MGQVDAAAQRVIGSRGLWERLCRHTPSGSLVLLLVTFPALVFLILPTVVVIPMALTPRRYIEFPPSGISGHSFVDLVQDQAWMSAAFTSFKVAAIAVLVGCFAGSTAAIALHGAKFPGKSVLVGVIVAPIVVPLVVLALANYQFFARYQLIGTVVAIGLAHSVIATPYAYLTVDASLAGLDPVLIRSARSLGAGQLAVLRHVYLPAIAPGLLAGAVFGFAVSFDEAVIALFLQGPGATTLPVKMFTDIQYNLSPKIAAVSSLLVGVATLVLLVHVVLVLRRRAQARVAPETPLDAKE